MCVFLRLDKTFFSSNNNVFWFILQHFFFFVAFPYLRCGASRRRVVHNDAYHRFDKYIFLLKKKNEEKFNDAHEYWSIYKIIPLYAYMCVCVYNGNDEFIYIYMFIYSNCAYSLISTDLSGPLRVRKWWKNSDSYNSRFALCMHTHKYKSQQHQQTREISF